MVDAVIAWVDGSDAKFVHTLDHHRAAGAPEFVAQKWRARSSYTGQFEARERQSLSKGRSGKATAATEEARFRNNGELRYVLRSIETFAPFIDRIFLLTNGQRPDWLVPDHPRLRWVTHADIFPDPSVLPTFNSSAIETNLHRIPGLSDDFIYFNDDFFFGRPVGLEDFKSPEGIYKLFVEAETPLPQTMTDRSLIGHCWAFNHSLIADRFGPQDKVRMFAHTPQMYNRWLAQEVELVWREEIENTRRHRFRTPFDAHMRLLYTYYVGNPKQQLRAFNDAKGVARIVGLKASDYCSVRFGDDRSLYVKQLGEIARLRPKFFCINDEFVAHDSAENAVVTEVVESFLSSFFPTPSSFEKPSRAAPAKPAIPLQPPALTVTGIQVAAVSPSVEGRTISVWHRAAGEPHFQAHPVRSKPSPDKLIRPGDEIRIDDESAVQGYELRIILSCLEDAERPLAGFKPDRSMRIEIPHPPGTILKADDWIAEYLRRQALIDAIDRRMAPFVGRLLHDPMAGFLHADRAIQSGKVDKSAIHLLEQAISGGVEPVWVFHRLALAHLARGEHYPEAVQAVRHALDSSPSAAFVFQELAEALAEKGMYGEALPTADGLLRHNSGDRRASYVRSLCRLHFNADDAEVNDLIAKDALPAHIALWARIMRRRLEPASTVLPKLLAAVKNKKHSFEVFVALAMAHEDAGNRAETLLAISLAMNTGISAEATVAAARDCLSEGRAATARLLLDAVRARMPWVRDGIVLRARLKIAEGDLGQAVLGELDDAIAGNIDVEAARLAKAAFFMASGRDNEMLAELKACGAIGDVAAALDLSEGALRHGRPDAALAIAELVRKQQPNQLPAHRRWSELALDAGRPAAEIEHAIAAAVAAGAKTSWAGLLRTRLALREGRLKELAGIVDAGMKSDGDAAAFMALADGLAKSGSGPAARALLDAIVAVRPDDEPALLRLATLAVDSGETNDGIRQIIDRLVTISPDPYLARLLRFQLALRAGRAGEAADELRHLDEMGGDIEPFLDALEVYRGQAIYDSVTHRRFEEPEVADDARS